MKILHLSAADYGGAGIAAKRLHLNLRTAGIDSRMWTLNSRSNEPTIQSIIPAWAVFRLRRLFFKAWTKFFTEADYGFQTQGISPGISIEKLLKRENFVPDIVVVHYISNFLSAEDLLRLQRATKAHIVWHLLDMAPLTGGCHYAWSCEGYMAECGNCPALRSRKQPDLSSKTLQRKAHSLDRRCMTVIAPSSTLDQQARRSSLFRDTPIEDILLAVDPKTFLSRDTGQARSALGLPLQNKVILFGAQRNPNRRKGMEQLRQALTLVAANPQVRHEDVVLASIGEISQLHDFSSLGFRYVDLGLMKDDEALAVAYSAADIFVCPSIQDSGPMMINEAMMSGLPVVCFDMGVARDLVVSDKTGYIAELGSPLDLANKLSRMLSKTQHDLETMSANCRDRAIATCDPRIQQQKFIELFQRIMSARHTP